MFAARHCAQRRLIAPRRLSSLALTALLTLGLTRVAMAASGDAMHFAIDARLLSPALLQFSRQSGISIVFPDRLTRDVASAPVIGTMSTSEALDMLLENTGLNWQLVNDHIVAVFDQQCDGGQVGEHCSTAEQTLARYPVYVPGIEETYVYGNRFTGSRIRRSGYTGAAPVDVLSAPDIELSGAQTIGELLKFVPAVAGNSTSTAISNGGDGTASVTLRGLPASNTLVLINGKRVANDGLAGESVDLNSIPPAAVERIEILKDGASAIYGSDAIAGVVNVIMKRDFYGLLAEAYYGQAERGDLETATQTLQYGTGFNAGSMFISASHYQQQPIFSRDRKISRSADTSAIGGSDERSSATADARVTLPDGSVVIADGSGYRPATEDDLFDYQAFTTAVVPLERTSLYGNVSYDFSDQVTSFVELSYLKTSTEAVLAPSPVFTAFEQTPLPVAADNIYNPFGTTIDDARRRLVEFPERRQDNESEVMRFNAVIEGLYSDWNWDVGVSWSRSEASEVTTSLVDAARLRRAVGAAANCLGPAIDGCVPVNLLGPAGSLDPEQVDYIRATGRVDGYSKLSSVTANFSNALLHLPHGRGDLAFGVEYRQEATSKRPNALFNNTNSIGAANQKTTRGERHITELYLESLLPAWRSRDESLKVDVERALRYSDYSDFGDSTNPKIGAKFQLGPSFLLRSTYSEGFRAPSLNELYEGDSEAQAFIDDPCAQALLAEQLPGCAQQADPTRNQFLTVTGGNPELAPETSTNLGIGVVWTPQTLPGFSLSADFFDIEQQDVVSSSAQFIVNQNAFNGDFAQEVERDSTGNLVLVRANNINVGERNIRGTDLALTYHHPRRAWGQLSITSSATYIDEYRASLDASSPELDLAGTFNDQASEGLGGIPRWKAQFGLRWDAKRWRGNYQIHYVGPMDETIPGTLVEREIDAWTIHDIQLSYEFDLFAGLRWTLGIDNLLDEAAPLAASAFLDNIDGRTHELKGRFWYTKLSQRF
jgi:iron complex outermembrane receptor protein